MEFIEICGAKFMKVMPHSAIKPDGKDRLQVLTVDETGTLQCKSQTVSPKLYNAVSSVYGRSNGKA